MTHHGWSRFAWHDVHFREQRPKSALKSPIFNPSFIARQVTVSQIRETSLSSHPASLQTHLTTAPRQVTPPKSRPTTPPRQRTHEPCDPTPLQSQGTARPCEVTFPGSRVNFRESQSTPPPCGVTPLESRVTLAFSQSQNGPKPQKTTKNARNHLPRPLSA